MLEEAEELIKKLGLEKHPEGGYFKQIYKSKDSVVPPERFNSTERSAGTSIYFLLSEEDYSAWHKLKADEIWHFYKGTSLTIHSIDSKGNLKSSKLGDPLQEPDANFQVIIQAEQWFAAEVNDKGSYTFVGCTVNPGFEYGDFELANRVALAYQYPKHADIINRLSRDKLVVEIKETSDGKKPFKSNTLVK